MVEAQACGTSGVNGRGGRGSGENEMLRREEGLVIELRRTL
jgi:hypothetical protein